VAPAVSGEAAANITAASADVSWLTNEPAASQVDYGPSSSYGSVFFDPDYVTDHSVSLAGLSPGTTYHWRAVSADPAGNTTSGPDQTFVTLCSAPTLSVTSRRHGNSLYADLSWTASSGAFILLASPAGTTYTDPLPSSPGYEYEYYAAAVNAEGAESAPSNTVVVSGTEAPPVISNVAAEPGQVTCVITWDTDEPATSQVFYDTVSHAGGGHYAYESQLDSSLVTSHSVTLTGLQAGTTYYFCVESEDTTGNTSRSGETQFDPAPMADGYHLYSRDLVDPSAVWILLTDTTDTSYVDGRFDPHGTYSYEYYVTAYNEVGESGESNHVTHTESNP